MLNTKKVRIVLLTGLKLGKACSLWRRIDHADSSATHLAAISGDRFERKFGFFLDGMGGEQLRFLRTFRFAS